MSLGFVVTTLGRLEAIDRLLGSLDSRLEPADRLVIVAQDHADDVRALVAVHPTLAASTVVTTSARGASRGRNAGVAALDDPQALLCFPNDTTWFPEGTVEALREADAAGLMAGAMVVADENGPKFTLPKPGTPLDRWNVWSVIEMGLVMRRTVFDDAGGFDEGIGTGATTPWQAGEATDLLLRLQRDQPVVSGSFSWLPHVVVGGISDSRGLAPGERRRKLRAYGRGLGRLAVQHRYPLWWRGAFVAGGLLFGLRHSDIARPVDGAWVFLGRMEGILGRALGATPVEAVTR